MSEISANNFISLYLSKLKENKIIYSECKNCGHKHLPPIPHCSNCGSNDFEIKEAQTEGVIETYTVIRISSDKFESQVPFAVAVVKLIDDVKLMSQVKTDDLSKISVGKKVKANFAEGKEDASRLYFVLLE